MITQVNGQWKVKIESEKVLLLCDETYYYSDPITIPRGVTWSGRPCSIFTTEAEALQYVQDNNLTKYVEPENEII
jgi:hypothetical protein